MGCDIHAFYEIKVEDKWIGYGKALFQRNYEFFARLANVRNYFDIIPIDQPRGLPDDISELTSLHAQYWGEDGHSHSWINAEEYTQLMKEFTPQELNGKNQSWYEPGLIYLFGNSFHTWLEYPDDYPAFIQDFRLVFWFDN